VASGVFIELYLYGISSFQPKSDAVNGKGITGTLNYTSVKTIVADHGGIPFLKTYKDFMFVYGMRDNRAVADIFLTDQPSTENKKTVDVARKMDTKFDDGIFNSGNITGRCNGSDSVGYTTAIFCNHIFFYYDVK
jgi:hypothetical protein